MKKLLMFLGAVSLLFGILVAAPAQAVVGGTTAASNPGVASLWTMGPNVPHRNRCGATLIKDRWLVTSAHCWDVLNGNQPEARFGLDNTAPTAVRGISAHFIAPGFDPNTFANDLMLLKLDAPVPTSVQKPMGYTLGSPAVGTTGRVSGWGWPCETPGKAGCGVSVSGPLRQANITVTADNNCSNAFGWSTSYYFCVTSSDGGPEMACFGDSGVAFYTKDAIGNFWWRGVFNIDGDDPNGGSCGAAPDGGPPRGAVTDGYPQLGWMISVMTNN